MKLKCLIVEDEIFAQNIIERYISRIPSIELVATCKDVKSAEYWIINREIDLIFLDINLPVMTGVEFAKYLKKKNNKSFKVGQPYIVFTTGYPEYASKAFDVDAIDYLLKPIFFDRFYQSVLKVIKAIQIDAIFKTNTEIEIIDETSDVIKSIFVKTGKNITKVYFDDIYYIEGLKEYISFFTKTGRLVSYNRMKKIETILPAKEFVRIHKSYIIAKSKIQKINKNTVVINEMEIPIGRKYKKMIEKFLNS